MFYWSLEAGFPYIEVASDYKTGLTALRKYEARFFHTCHLTDTVLLSINHHVL